MSDAWQLESSTDRWLLEDGSGVWLLEADPTIEVLVDLFIEVVPGSLREAEILADIFVEVVPASLVEGTATTPTPTLAGSLTRPRWMFRVVDMDGVIYAELPSALPDAGSALVERDNGGVEARWSMSMDDPGWEYVRFAAEDNREIQVWLDGDLKLWGPVMRGPVDLNRRTVQCQAFNPEEYLRRRFVGDAERQNLLANPGFENHPTSATGWSMAWTYQIGGVGVDGIPANEGDNHLTLTSAASRANQAHSVTHTFDPGLLIRFAVWWRRESAAVMPEGGVMGGIWARDSETGIRYPGTMMTVDAASNVGAWTRAWCDILLAKARVPYTVEVELRGAAGGNIRYDSGQLVFNDSLTVAYPGEDVARFVTNLIWHLQDAGYGKDDIRLGTDCPDTGIIRLLSEPHEQHRYGIQVLDDLVKAGYFDWSVALTPYTRTFTIHPGGRGTDRPEWRLEVGRNVATGMLDVDGTQVNRNVLYQADASDFARDEASATAGTGPIFETVRRAAAGTPVRFLGEFAARDVAFESGVPVIPDVTIVDRDRTLIHGLVPGDTLPALIAVGNSSLDGVRDFRVVEKATAGTADRLRCKLAPA